MRGQRVHGASPASVQVWPCTLAVCHVQLDPALLSCPGPLRFSRLRHCAGPGRWELRSRLRGRGGERREGRAGQGSVEGWFVPCAQCRACCPRPRPPFRFSPASQAACPVRGSGTRNILATWAVIGVTCGEDMDTAASRARAGISSRGRELLSLLARPFVCVRLCGTAGDGVRGGQSRTGRVSRCPGERARAQRRQTAGLSPSTLEAGGRGVGRATCLGRFWGSVLPRAS